MIKTPAIGLFNAKQTAVQQSGIENHSVPVILCASFNSGLFSLLPVYRESGRRAASW